MPVSAGDTIKLWLRGTCFGQRIILDLSYFVNVGNGVLTTAQVLNELNNAVAPGAPAATNIADNYRACLPPQFNLDEIRSQVVRPIRSAFTSLGLAGFAGTNANPATVACDSASITRRTALAGRDQVSVLKVGPCPDGASAAGLLTVAYANLLGPLGADTIKPLLLPVSTVQMRAEILTPAGNSTGRIITNFFVQPESRVMTRRVVGRGE